METIKQLPDNTYSIVAIPHKAPFFGDKLYDICYTFKKDGAKYTLYKSLNYEKTLEILTTYTNIYLKKGKR